MNSSLRSFPLLTSAAAFSGSVLLAVAWRNAAVPMINLEPWVAPVSLVYFLDVEKWIPDLLLSLSPLFLALLAGVTLIPRRGWALGRRAVTGLAYFSTGTLLLLCLISVARGVTHPPINAFLGRLFAATHEIPPPGIEHKEELKEVTLASLQPGAPQKRPIRYSSYSPGPNGLRETVIGGLTVFQQCGGEGCRVALAQSARDFQARFEGKPDVSVSGWAPDLPSAPLQSWGETIRFAQDPSANVLFLERNGKSSEYRLDQGIWYPTELSSARIAARTSPPSSWLWVGVLGLIAAALLVVLRRRIHSREREMEGARPGTLGKDGLVTFADGSLATVDSPGGLAIGPVFVLGGQLDSAYRRGGPLPRENVRVGIFEEHLARLRFDMLRCDAAIAAFTCLTSAPLLGAALAGLVL